MPIADVVPLKMDEDGLAKPRKSTTAPLVANRSFHIRAVAALSMLLLCSCSWNLVSVRVLLGSSHSDANAGVPILEDQQANDLTLAMLAGTAVTSVNGDPPLETDDAASPKQEQTHRPPLAADEEADEELESDELLSSDALPSQDTNVTGPWAPIKSIAELDEYECVSWRQTSHCSSSGGRNPSGDLPCEQRLKTPNAGYCEYRNRRTGELRFLMGASCGSRYSGLRLTCMHAKKLLAYNLKAVEYLPRQPLSYEECQQDLIKENECVSPAENVVSAKAIAKHRKAPESFSKGIVMVIYDKLLLSVYASIRSLRKMGSQLPVELWYNADETDTAHPLIVELRDNYGAFLREIRDPRASRFYTKIYASFYSAFDRVLLLDADNFPVRDPAYLFSTKAFNDTGAIFWPDFWCANRTIFNINQNSFVWELLGVDYVDMFEQESGQVLIDRRRHERAMHALLHYGLTEPHYPDTLHLLWGDKDLFRMAWMRTNSSFHMIQRPPGSAGIKAKFLDIFCGVTMVQHDPLDEIIFLHRNIVKFSSDQHERQWTHIQQYKRDQHLGWYNVKGVVDHKLFPQFRKCYGKRIGYRPSYTVRAIESFPFADIETDLISFVQEGMQIQQLSGWKLVVE